MLPLRPFEFYEPKTLEELGTLLQWQKKIKIVAGGTDVLPNLKHGLYDIDALVSLKRIKELHGITIKNNTISLGALTPLSMVAEHLELQSRIPALCGAASLVASPQIRHMGTVGGNICLDTRCLYFNQSEFWRNALGYCLKKDGDACHVVKTGKRCVAASSNDLATILIALDATITLWSSNGEKTFLLDDFYTANGVKNNQLNSDQIVTRVEFKLTEGLKAGFAKLRHRESIDFSLISAGVSYVKENKNIKNIKVVVNALVAKPKVMVFSEYDNSFLDDNLIGELAQKCSQKCHPQTNICDDPEWRKEMVKCYIKKAFEQAGNG